MRLFEALISMIKHPKTGESQTYSAGREVFEISSVFWTVQDGSQWINSLETKGAA